MHESLKPPAHPGMAAGFALVTVLAFIVILSVLGGVLHHAVSGDITHSGKDSRRVRAEFAAETAVQWGLLELSRRRANSLPFSLATHQKDGTTPFSGVGLNPEDRYTGPWPLHVSDLTAFPAAEIVREQEGWIAMRSRDAARNISGGKDEYIAFKAWYPNDTTLRISGRAVVDGSRANLDLVSTLHVSKVPL
jgi:hypothetical protein